MTTQQIEARMLAELTKKQRACDAIVAIKDAEIAQLTERLAIASRRLQGLMAEQNIGLRSVDRAQPKLPPPPWIEWPPA